MLLSAGDDNPQGYYRLFYGCPRVRTNEFQRWNEGVGDDGFYGYHSNMYMQWRVSKMETRKRCLESRILYFIL